MIRSGLLGRSILASRSPWLHEQEAAAQGLALTYELFDFTDRGWDDARLAATVAELVAAGFSGCNVTYPFKQAVMPLLDELAGSAQAVGAVNTIVIRDGRTIGHNTDMGGFRQGLIDGLPGAELGHVLQLGAGGAGAAVASALLSLGCRRLDLCDLDAARAEDLARQLRRTYGAAEVHVRAAGDHDTAGVTGIVNSTPIGMVAAPGLPIDPARLHEGLWVADIVYFPLETELLAAAARLGCRTLNGSGMVIGQAAEAFTLITGHAADRDRMRRRFLG
ncbi:MAG: shikimate dehydrogenase [Sphingomonas fennica]